MWPPRIQSMGRTSADYSSGSIYIQTSRYSHLLGVLWASSEDTSVTANFHGYQFYFDPRSAGDGYATKIRTNVLEILNTASQQSDFWNARVEAYICLGIMHMGEDNVRRCFKSYAQEPDLKTAASHFKFALNELGDSGVPSQNNLAQAFYLELMQQFLALYRINDADLNEEQHRAYLDNATACLEGIVDSYVVTAQQEKTAWKNFLAVITYLIPACILTSWVSHHDLFGKFLLPDYLTKKGNFVAEAISIIKDSDGLTEEEKQAALQTMHGQLLENSITCFDCMLPDPDNTNNIGNQVS